MILASSVAYIRSRPIGTAIRRVALTDILYRPMPTSRPLHVEAETTSARTGISRVLRAWNTDQVLPHYEGECLIYLDMRGPVLVRTFLRGGKRCWDGLDCRLRV